MSPKPRKGSMATAALSNMGDDYLALIDANHRGSVVDAFREEREAHQATRPCPLCRVAMVDGACEEHGIPAEDGGAWLWAPTNPEPDKQRRRP